MTAPVWKSTTMALRALVSKLGRCAAAGAAAATPAARSAPVRKRESTRLFMRPLSIRCILGGAIRRDLQHAPGLRRNCDGRAASINDDARFREAGVDHAAEQPVGLIDAVDGPEPHAVDVEAADARAVNLDRPERIEPRLDAQRVVGMREGAGLDVDMRRLHGNDGDLFRQ